MTDPLIAELKAKAHQSTRAHQRLTEHVCWRAQARIEADAARLEMAREALKPFADAAENMDGCEHDNANLWETPEAGLLVYRDLRRAAQALKELSQ